MTSLFSVDGQTYNVIVPTGGLKRSGQILDGQNAGRLQSGRMERDIIGTYYNYSLTIDTRGLSNAAYDSLYQVLTAPVDYHVITMPYGQGTITFDAYVSGVEDQMLSNNGSRTFWGEMTVDFIAMGPQRTP